jgi:nucleoside-diphosphate-sugar epimerase
MDDATALSGRKILVTGAAGFIGARLVEKLADQSGALVTALVRDSNKAESLQARGVRTIVTDLSDRRRVESAVEGQHTVINLAYDFKRSEKYNLKCFNHLSEACIKHGVEHFIQTSSIAVYDGWPTGNLSEESPFEQTGSEYKNAKLAIELDLLRSAERGLLGSTILQPTIVYGPFSWLWTDHVVEKLLNGTVMLPGNADGFCNAVYVDDVANALVLAALFPGRSGDKFIISGPSPTTWREYYESHNQYLGTASIQYIDAEILAHDSAAAGASLRNAWANPLLLANLKPVRGVLNLVQRVLGDRGIDRLKSLAGNLKGPGNPITYYPTAGEIELYSAGGICSIEKAEKLLGYVPAFDFKSGFDLTARYLDRKLNRV